MFKSLILACMLVMVGCATPTVREQKLQCVERFLDQQVDALKAKEVCQWSFEHK